MPSHRVIIDCDPGQDDAINLLLALSSPAELDVLGITTVAGNVPLALTERNARLICELAGRADVPVFAGCDKPLDRPLVTAEDVHGGTGIDGMQVGEPSLALDDRHAVDFIVAMLKDAPADSITLVPTGPLTNIAAAIEQDRSILNGIKQFVLMGGALREGGNATPSAEFNMLVDPQAADIVLRCGRPIVMFGLDVTHQVLATHERIAAIRALNNPAAEAAAGMLAFFNRHDTAKYDILGAPLHDPCTVAWLMRPELFELKRCHVAVEVTSSLTMGHTAVDFWGVTGKMANAQWAHAVDADGFFALLIERLARFGRTAK